MKDLIEAVATATAIQPDGRRAAIAATLEQQAGFCTRHCADFGLIDPGQADILAAFERLGVPRDGDDGPTASRRATLREIVVAAGHLKLQGGDALYALAWFVATVAAFLDSEDPRQQAMAARAAAEAAELGDGLGQMLLDLRGRPEVQMGGTASGGAVRCSDIILASEAGPTRYVSDNIRPDRPITEVWWSGPKAVLAGHYRPEVCALIERAGGLFNDSCYHIPTWEQDDNGEWSRDPKGVWPAVLRPRAAVLGYLGPKS